MKRTRIVFSVLCLWISGSVSANQWVSGTVYAVEEYGNHGSGFYGVLITLSGKTWGSGTTSDGQANCIARFRAVVGQESVTEEIKSRIYSMALAAYLAEKPFHLYVNTTAINGLCAIEASKIGG